MASMDRHTELSNLHDFSNTKCVLDTIILSHILMSFDRLKMKLILDNCRAAMTTGAKLLIIEVILRNNTSQPAGRLNDLHMLVLLGGRYQNEQDYLTLLKQSNFIVESNIQMKIFSCAVQSNCFFF